MPGFIDSLFGTKPNIQTQPTPVPVSENVQQPTPAPAPQNTAPADPLANLWAPETDPNKNIPADFDFNIDPTNLATTAKKLDYSQLMTPEIKARIAAGGEDAINANFELMQSALRLSWMQSASSTTKLVEAAVQNTTDKISAMLDSKFKSMGLNNELSDNPVLSDPKFAPVVQNVKDQIIAKFPNATPAQMKIYLNNYFSDMSKAMNPEIHNAAARVNAPGVIDINKINQQDNTDWAAYMGFGG